MENNDCVFVRGQTILLVYTDDCLLFSPLDKEIDKCIKDMQTIFKVEDEGSIQDYLGGQVNKRVDGSFELNQPQLIDSILKDFGLLDHMGNPLPKVTTKATPSASKFVGADPQW